MRKITSTQNSCIIIVRYETTSCICHPNLFPTSLTVSEISIILYFCTTVIVSLEMDRLRPVFAIFQKTVNDKKPK